MLNDVVVTLFLKIAQQLFVCEYFLLIPIDVPSLKLIKRSDKGITGGGTKHPPGLRMTKKARAG